MPIQTSQPVLITDPTINYDNLGINLAISPIWQADRVGAAIAMTLTPYRQLTDGTIEKSTDVRSVVIGDAYIEQATDPDLATAVNAIYTALANYIAAKGL